MKKGIEYKDLTPTSEIENGQEYINSLNWAINNSHVKNIALAGPYGSGKSSIIKAYMKKCSDAKALNISLANFDVGEEGNGIDVETGILKQLFYKVNTIKIPQSRYRKIRKIKITQYIIMLAILSLFGLFVSGMLFPKKVMQAWKLLIDNGEYWGANLPITIILLLLGSIAAIIFIAHVIKWFNINFRLKEFKVANQAVISDNADAGESVFNKNIDEIIYFFESTKYDVVFIEDLDRFSDSTIFIKLRELNNILNNYEEIKRKITFVYAVKDDIFIGGERTKFFDFIIPVIPIINSTNSGEILRKKLDVKEVGDGIYRSSIYDISERYINMISPYIDDMRILINICNEFEIYRKTIGDSQELNLKDEQMFSLIVFKNLYPKEFAALEVEKGIVKTAFENKQNFINEKMVKLKEKNKKIQLDLENVEKDILNELKEVKAAFMNYLTDSKGALKYCNVNNQNIFYTDIMQDTFDLSVFENQKCFVYYYNRNSSSLLNITMDATKSEEKQIVSEYIQRCEYIQNNTEERKEELRTEIKKNETDLNRMRELSIKELIDRYGSDSIFNREVRENNLLVFLLRNGFLDENYSHYINYFHPNSIDPEEMNFILGIRNYKAVGGYDYPLRHPAQIIDRVEDFEFKQSEVLNYHLMDYMLNHMIDSKKVDILMKQLSNRKEESTYFIKAYIERDNNIECFIEKLCECNQYLWYDFMYDPILSEDEKYKYLSYILRTDIDDVLKLNVPAQNTEEGVFNVFLQERKVDLKKLEKVPENHIFDAIEKLQIKFRNINTEYVSNSILDFIYENQHYELNWNMLHCIFKTKYPDKIRGLIKANYTTILEAGYEPLLRCIESDFESYVEDFVLTPVENIEETVNAVDNILERLCNKNINLCVKVLEKEPVTWEHLTDCCTNLIDEDAENEGLKTIWNYVVENSKVKASWNNFYEYYDRYGLTDELISFLNDNIDALIADKDMLKISDDIIKSIIVKNIPLSTFEKIVSNITVDEFTNDLDEFVDEEIDVMIDINYFPFTIERLNEMKESFSDKCVAFILQNKDEFFDNIEQIALPMEDVLLLMKSERLTKLEKKKLFVLFKPEDVEIEMAQMIKELEASVDKKYVDAAWNLLSEENRKELLLNHISVYSCDELEEKFKEMGKPYCELADRKKHKVKFEFSKYNVALLDKLQNKGYLTSVKDEYILHGNFIKGEGKNTPILSVWVKEK